MLTLCRCRCFRRVTPRESMPEFVQFVMLAAPTTHFVMIALAAIGAALFYPSLTRFRKTIGTMA